MLKEALVCVLSIATMVIHVQSAYLYIIYAELRDGLNLGRSDTWCLQCRQGLQMRR